MTATPSTVPTSNRHRPRPDAGTTASAWGGSIRAEWIKFAGTPSTWIGLGLFMLVSLAMTVLEASSADPAGGTELTNTGIMSGAYGLGQIVFMVVAAVAITNEYGHGTINRSLLAVPRRWPLPVAKAIVVTGVAAVAATVACVLAVPTAMAVADPASQANIGLVAAGPTIAATIVLVAAGTLLALGMGAILRSTAGTVALLVVWPTMAEAVLARLPGPAGWLAAYLPFANAGWAVTGRQPFGLTMPWGRGAALVWFVTVCMTVFLLGVAASRRDP